MKQTCCSQHTTNCQRYLEKSELTLHEQNQNAGFIRTTIKSFIRKEKIIALFIGVLFTMHVLNAASGFYVSGSALKDANGNTFVIRGINNPHIWFDNGAYDALPDIKANGVNCVRIVWQANGKASRLEEIIKKCIDLKMVPMVELHDATGDNSYDSLKREVNYWLKDDIKTIVSKYEKYIMVNIANEFGNHDKSSWDWKEDYKKAITAMRNGGINTILVIDAPGWGQNAGGPLSYGQELIDHDPKHNILLSVHMYGSWNDSQTIKDKIDEFKTKNLPLLIGEFGYNYNNGSNNLGCKVDHKVVMQKCQEKGYGYMAWSWYGNNQENKWLDMTTDWKTLNYWGKEVINNTNGIKNTSNIASIFSGTSNAPIGKTIWIKANTNGKYVCADLGMGTNAPLNANRASVNSWEKFDVIDAGGGYIALKANSNGKYVCADLGMGTNAPLYANRASVGTWEKFQWVDAGGGYFALKASSTGKYVCADIGISTNAPMVANRPSIGGWEKFTFGTTTKSAEFIQENIDRTENIEPTIYPNPVYGPNITLRVSPGVASEVTIVAYNQTGKVVLRKALGTIEAAFQEISIPHNLSDGIYIFEIRIGDFTNKLKIIIK